jgi:predicted nucleotidyltransferase
METILHPDRYRKMIQLILKNEPDTVGIYLFGSQASGIQHPESDIDLAILPKQKIPQTRIWHLAQTLARHFSQDVDLVDLQQASTVMRMQVISKGQRLYCANNQFCEIFEDFVFSDYARLNEERADILRSIEQRGTVYG